MLGGRGATPPPDSPRDVSSCHPPGKKKGRMNDPLRLLAWPPTVRFCRQTYLLSNKWGPRPAEKRLWTSITKCINLRDCPDLCHLGWNGQVNDEGCCILFKKLSEVDRG